MTHRALVWFKRDLHVRDHAPLAMAAQAQAAAALFIVEPAWLQSAECDGSHVAFALDCLDELRQALTARGLPLLVRVGEARQVLQQVHARFPFTQLLSHEETGPAWSYARDLAVAAWCRQRSVAWQEIPQSGVIRRLRSRDGWAARWQARMDAPEIDDCAAFRPASGLSIDDLPSLAALGLAAHRKQLQPAGETAAWSTLGSFLRGRGHHYLRDISSPLRAEADGSRISPHPAFGTLSVGSAYQATGRHLAGSSDPAVRRALRGFAGRLRRHCHFMQKLKSQPSMEWRNLARACDGLRDHRPEPARFDAWGAGQTGYPIVDACIICGPPAG